MQQTPDSAIDHEKQKEFFGKITALYRDVPHVAATALAIDKAFETGTLDPDFDAGSVDTRTFSPEEIEHFHMSMASVFASVKAAEILDRDEATEKKFVALQKRILTGDLTDGDLTDHERSVVEMLSHGAYESTLPYGGAEKLQTKWSNASVANMTADSKAWALWSAQVGAFYVLRKLNIPIDNIVLPHAPATKPDDGYMRRPEVNEPASPLRFQLERIVRDKGLNLLIGNAGKPADQQKNKVEDLAPRLAGSRAVLLAAALIAEDRERSFSFSDEALLSALNDLCEYGSLSRREKWIAVNCAHLTWQSTQAAQDAARLGRDIMMTFITLAATKPDEIDKDKDQIEKHAAIIGRILAENAIDIGSYPKLKAAAEKAF